MRVIKRTYQMHGVSLVEAVVTVGVVMLLITGLVIGMTSSLKNAQGSKARATAVQLAQDGMEVLRAQRDSDWITFAANGTLGVSKSYCLDTTVLETLGESCTRSVVFTTIDAEQIDVTVTVVWKEGSVDKTVELKTTFTKWK